MATKQEQDAFFTQLMITYLNGFEPCKEYAEADKEFTTRQVVESIEPMLECVTMDEVYDYLVGEGYEPQLVAGELLWLAKKKEVN